MEVRWMPHQTMTGPLSDVMQRCIQDCLDCYRSCLETISHCLELGGRHADKTHISLLQDCAQICESTAASMFRLSGLHHQLVAVCAEACDRCAESCEQIADGDRTMLECAEISRRCAESCRQMAAA
jgi:hypothetical protein